MSEMENTLDGIHRLSIAEENSTEWKYIRNSQRKQTTEPTKQPQWVEEYH